MNSFRHITGFEKIKYFVEEVLHWKVTPTLFTLSVIMVVVFLFLYSLSRKVFDEPTCTTIYASNGELIGARLASDGQWRFPPCDSLPEKYSQCLLLFEDRFFFRHPGFNPLSFLRAAYQNFLSGKTVSGGSTLTMQTIRLSRKGKPRNIFQKVIEIFLAVHLEIGKSKQEILALYASNAPFGGNVVGLDAASWRYFGRSPHNLSWAESACLAVLPNAPSLIHPGRNREALKKKRNRLLDRMLKSKVISPLEYDLSIEEPIPDEPVPLPDDAFHLVSRLSSENNGKLMVSTIDPMLQRKVNEIANRHHRILQYNNIHNLALMVLKVKTGEVVAYIGNTGDINETKHGCQVDIITSPRSSGSLLKPLLYAAMLDDGELLPQTLVADIPTTINDFSPKNFDITYDGAVPAREALIRSLNVPAVRMLSAYSPERFYAKLKQCGFTTLTYPPGHYGLSLILGGAEVNLWDICMVYRNLAVKLTAAGNAPCSPSLLQNDEQMCREEKVPFSKSSIWLTLDAMKDVRRPDNETGWESFLSSHPIAWKTGTSFGFRDAWAVGITPDFVVGVWAGNADGEGRPGLTGIKVAAPVMFDVFSVLPFDADWFEPPLEEMEPVPVCRQSGMRPSHFCSQTDTVWIGQAGLKTKSCPYHSIIHLDKEMKYRVNANCYPVDQIKTTSWFTLPPAMAWFYKSKNPFYQNLPPWLPGCESDEKSSMQLIWPDKPSKIYLPLQADGKPGLVVFEAAHLQPSKIIYWYSDNQFLGATQNLHKMEFQPATGKHTLVLMDEDGNMLDQAFEVVGKK